MRIPLLYGKSYLNLKLNDNYNIDVIEPNFIPGLKNEFEAISKSLKNPIRSKPLRDLVTKNQKVGIVFSDITRATPYNKILPALLSELSHIPDENIIFFNATGTHRANTYEELISIIGNKYIKRFKILQNNCNDKSLHIKIGTATSGNEIFIMKYFVECDLKILTGFIEPHFFAGFSGGGKAAMPGLASLNTIMQNHCAANIDNHKAKWGITTGNPIWEEAHEAAAMLDNTFLLNVALNKNHEITAVFSGDVKEAHVQGCGFVKTNAMQPVDSLYDIVVASNSGYPLDLNLYQSVKGMSAAAQIVKKGGSIIMAADCWDGIPKHGAFGKILNSANSVEELLEKVRDNENICQDKWQAQILGLILQKANVYFYSNNLSDYDIRNAFLIPCKNIENEIGNLNMEYNKNAKVCVLPEGPQTIPFLVEE